MKKVLPYLGLVVVVIGISILLVSQFGKSSNAQMSIDESTKFSEEEIEAAVASVKRVYFQVLRWILLEVLEA